ncbi:MAG TPA: transglutaminase-like cysteine peptidase [Rhizomicrobium sp.]|nr:transglutaminase-like cysteine peptidase [Rhizomicrobium sp.]
MRRLAGFVGIALAAFALAPAPAQEIQHQAILQDSLSAIAPFAAVSGQTPGRAQMPGGEAAAPSGYLAFCDRNPGECRTHRGQPDRIALNDESWAMLEKVNIAVNNMIRPVDDSEHYGVAEFWAVPVDGEGDCEDYVLAKRKMLTLLGLPPDALRITVALNRRRERHAVLTVVSDRGDYILDNAQDDILPAQETDYRWVERQDAKSRTGWLALN